MEALLFNREEKEAWGDQHEFQREDLAVIILECLFTDVVVFVLKSSDERVRLASH